MVEPNLLVTFDPPQKKGSEAEARKLLSEAGEEGPEFLPVEVGGVFEVRVKGDPKALVGKLRAACAEHPEKFKHTHRWIPIEEWTESDLQHLEQVVAKAGQRIQPQERWRLKVVKRNYAQPSPRIVEALARHIDRPNVDLVNPEKVVRVEIVENHAGVSVLGEGEWLNVAKVRSGS